MAERADRERRERERWYYRENIWPHVKAWLRCDPDAIRGYDMRTPRPLPRVNGDMVQTTWGASVPLEAAMRAYRLAKHCRAAKREFIPNGPAIREQSQIGDYRLTRIKPNGDLVIGCHDIPYHFMRYAAMRAGLEPKA